MPLTSTSFKKGHKRSPNAGRKRGSGIFTSMKEAFIDALKREGPEEFFKKVLATQAGRIAFMNCLARLLPVTEKVHHDHDFTGLSEAQLMAIVAQGEPLHQGHSLEVVEPKSLTN